MKKEDLKKLARLKIEDLSSNEPIKENLGFDETQVNNP